MCRIYGFETRSVSLEGCHGNFRPGTNFFMENWSYAENFGPAMDQFSMEFWSGGPFFHEYSSGGPLLSGKIGPGRLFSHGILVQETNFFFENSFYACNF